MNGLFGEAFEINIPKKASVKSLLKKVNPEQAEQDKNDISKVLKSKVVSLDEKLAIITDRVLSTLGKQKNNVLVIKDKETLHNYISDCIKIGRIDIDTETNNSLDPVTCLLMGPCFYAPGLKQAYVPLNHRDPKTKERLSWQLTEQDIHDELQRIVDSKTMVIMHNGKFDYEVIKCTCNIKVKPDWDTIIAARLIDENEFSEKRTSLKYIYTKYIDPSQAKYDIDELFKGVQYADVKPEIFALYAATDAMMTDKLYEMQKPILDLPENEKLKWVFTNIEMPIVIVTAEMELKGVAVDTDFGEKLKIKYDNKLEALDNKINKKLAVLKEIIKFWKTLPEANKKTRSYQPKKTKKSLDEIEKAYPYFDAEVNKRYKIGKCRADQIKEDISLTSSTQVAVLFYDILHCPAVSKKSPRGTGESEIKELAEKLKTPDKILKTIIESLMNDITELKQNKVSYIEEEEVQEVPQLKTNSEQSLFSIDKLDEEEPDFEEEQSIEDEHEIDISIPQITVKLSPAMTNKEIQQLIDEATELYKVGLEAAQALCQAILDRRGIVKLVSTYIDVIPDLTKHWPDRRIRFHLNSMGTDTGRYSSGGKLKFIENDEAVEVSGINIQNIPSHNKEIRMLFKAKEEHNLIEPNDNCYELPEISEIETIDGWKYGKDLVIGDTLISEDGPEQIKNILFENKTYYLYI